MNLFYGKGDDAPKDSAPEPSTSSTLSVSRIEKWLYPEGSSAAPNEGQQPQGEVEEPIPASGEGAPSNQEGSTPVPHGVASPGPVERTFSEVRDSLSEFLNSFRKRRSPSSFIDSACRELDLENASPHKREKILHEIQKILQGQNRPNSAQDAKARLLINIEKWEREIER